ncbi:unnamed protein product [Sympodiomycopsis kandeliae]
MSTSPSSSSLQQAQPRSSTSSLQYDTSQQHSPHPVDSETGDDRPPPSPSSTSQISEDNDVDVDTDVRVSRAFSLSERRATLRGPVAAPTAANPPSATMAAAAATPQSPNESSISDISYQFNAFDDGDPTNGELYYSPFNLPAEIVTHIFKFLLSRSMGNTSLRNCLLVCRFWSDCGVSLLWHRPTFYRLSSLVKLIQVTKSPNPTYDYISFIRRLNFSGIAKELTDPLFSFMASCTHLERLALGECRELTDGAIQNVLSSLRNLMSIDLTAIDNVTDETLFTLAKNCKRLQGINLSNCKKITSAGVGALGDSCTLLRRVKLCGCENVGDEGVFRMVQKCPTLLELDLYNCPRISDLAVRHIWIFSSHIRELRLSNCGPMTDMAFPAPPRLYSNSTAALDLDSPGSVGMYRDHLHNAVASFQGSDSAPASRGSSPSGAGRHPTSAAEGNGNELPKGLTLSMSTPLRPPKPFEHLRMLDLTNCSTISDDAIEGIIANASRIRNLNLSKCTRLTDEAVFSIAKLKKQIQFLHLGHVANITDRSVCHLVNECTRLRYLDLACCSQLTDLSVTELAAKLPKLKRIGLVRVQRITDESLYALVERHLSLQRIHLSYCTDISVAAVFWLLEKLSRVTHISLTGVTAFRRPELQAFCREPPPDFSTHQRESFCVYSGPGVRNLQQFLRHVYSSEETASQFGAMTPEVQRAIQLVNDNADRQRNSRRLHFNRLPPPSAAQHSQGVWAADLHRLTLQNDVPGQRPSHPLSAVAGDMSNAAGTSRMVPPSSVPATATGSGWTVESSDGVNGTSYPRLSHLDIFVPELWRNNPAAAAGDAWPPEFATTRNDRYRPFVGWAPTYASRQAEADERAIERDSSTHGSNGHIQPPAYATHDDLIRSWQQSQMQPHPAPHGGFGVVDGSATGFPGYERAVPLARSAPRRRSSPSELRAPYISRNEPVPIGQNVSGNGRYYAVVDEAVREPVQHLPGNAGRSVANAEPVTRLSAPPGNAHASPHTANVYSSTRPQRSEEDMTSQRERGQIPHMAEQSPRRERRQDGYEYSDAIRTLQSRIQAGIATEAERNAFGAIVNAQESDLATIEAYLGVPIFSGRYPRNGPVNAATGDVQRSEPEPEPSTSSLRPPIRHPPPARSPGHLTPADQANHGGDYISAGAGMSRATQQDRAGDLAMSDERRTPAVEANVGTGASGDSSLLGWRHGRFQVGREASSDPGSPMDSTSTA